MSQGYFLFCLQHAEVTKQHTAEKKLVEEKEQIIKVLFKYYVRILQPFYA